MNVPSWFSPACSPSPLCAPLCVGPSVGWACLAFFSAKSLPARHSACDPGQGGRTAPASLPVLTPSPAGCLHSLWWKGRGFELLTASLSTSATWTLDYSLWRNANAFALNIICSETKYFEHTFISECTCLSSLPVNGSWNVREHLDSDDNHHSSTNEMFYFPGDRTWKGKSNALVGFIAQTNNLTLSILDDIFWVLGTWRAFSNW